MVWSQVLLRHQTGGVAHEVMTSEGLREGDDIPDAGSPHNDGHQPVQTYKKKKEKKKKRINSKCFTVYHHIFYTS